MIRSRLPPTTTTNYTDYGSTRHERCAWPSKNDQRLHLQKRYSLLRSLTLCLPFFHQQHTLCIQRRQTSILSRADPVRNERDYILSFFPGQTPTFVSHSSYHGHFVRLTFATIPYCHEYSTSHTFCVDIKKPNLLLDT
jgi:hypothetical protein